MNTERRADKDEKEPFGRHLLDFVCAILAATGFRRADPLGVSWCFLICFLQQLENNMYLVNIIPDATALTENVINLLNRPKNIKIIFFRNFTKFLKKSQNGKSGGLKYIYYFHIRPFGV